MSAILAAEHLNAAEAAEEDTAIQESLPSSFWQDDWQELIKSHHEWLDVCEKDEEIVEKAIKN